MEFYGCRNGSRRIEYLAPEKYAIRVVQMICDASAQSIAANGEFILGLSGGRTPQSLFPVLVEKIKAEGINLSRWRFFWSDERVVPYESVHSNFGVAWRMFLDPLGVAPENIFPMDGSANDASAAAARYERELRTFFGNHEDPRFDLFLLGMGGDGHTASVFAEDSRIDEREPWCRAVEVASEISQRITLTLPIINLSRKIIMLASGKEKRLLAEAILAGEQSAMPVAKVCPIDGEITWLCEENHFMKGSADVR